MKKIRLKDQLGRVIRVPTGERQAPQPQPAQPAPQPSAPSTGATLWRLVREVPANLQRLAAGAGALVPGPGVTLTGDLAGRLVGAGDVQIRASAPPAATGGEILVADGVSPPVMLTDDGESDFLYQG